MSAENTTQTELNPSATTHTTDDLTDDITEDALPHLEGAPPADFWEDFRDSLPDWLDEIVAIALLIFGGLSFMALLNPSQAVVAVAWSDILNNLFGRGSFMVAGGLFLLGVILLLPKVGVVLKFSPLRTVALEIAFLCVLAILHLLVADDELRAIVREGTGGGVVGWGLTAIPFWLIGRGPSLVFFSLVLTISLGLVIGLRQAHIVNGFLNLYNRLTDLGDQLDPPMLTPVESAAAGDAIEPTEMDPSVLLAAQKTPVMRIRPNPENLPPSLRPGAQPEPEPDPVDVTGLRIFGAPEELKADFNMVGEITKKKDAQGHRLVIRPDGREKRYFSVEEMDESKKIGRRDKLLPDLEILQDIPMTVPSEDEINHTVVLVENTLLEFDIDIDVVDVQVGPTVTRYAVQPYHSGSDGKSARVKLSKIAGYVNDLSLALSAKRLRLELPVPGTNYMGIEVPNKEPSTVALRSVYESKAFYEKQQKSGSDLMVPLGRDVSGRPVSIDLAKMPHLLIAGTTGSGKSVCIAALASALILNARPDRVKMVMLDPKMVELSRFNGLPHLMGPVETDTERIIGVLKWCTREMDRRYKLLEEHAVRNIDTYNEKFGQRRRGRDYMPYIVIFVDEIGDLMLSRPEETETAITRLAQMARAVGMHLVIATQRPSVDVITGLIKANFPGRIAFSVASGVDSRVILDYIGAESLLGKGDMLYLAPDAGVPRRIQGCYVTDDEVRQLVEHWTLWYDEQVASGKAERTLRGPWERGLTRREFLSETDPMLEDAIEFVVETQEASASIIQRRLGLGYPRAARIMDMLEDLGVVGESVGGGRARKVLIPKGEDPFKRIIDMRLQERDEQSSTEDA